LIGYSTEEKLSYQRIEDRRSGALRKEYVWQSKRRASDKTK